MSCLVEVARDVLVVGHDGVKGYVIWAGLCLSIKQHAQISFRSIRKLVHLMSMPPPHPVLLPPSPNSFFFFFNHSFVCCDDTVLCYFVLSCRRCGWRRSWRTTIWTSRTWLRCLPCEYQWGSDTMWDVVCCANIFVVSLWVLVLVGVV